ncbi:MAG TPA: glutamine-hydrolyzing carbamoyl-phosphate synthase small subunit [Candidatus Omnitrophota bacterium]|nr:glutamine-hydrolyzing carbamoyl-phosphate synthase small subunit [Candidatus Omnitrophota bacterium]
MKAMIMLEDGHSFSGQAFGAVGERIGKLALNTAVVGYQEMLTDPANAGKILVLTYPLIGNYGVADKFNESDTIWTSGLIIKEHSRIYSNWQATGSLEAFVKAQNLMVLSDVDTRTLAVHLRSKGEMLGIISSDCGQVKELQAKLDAFRNKPAISMLPEISVKTVTAMEKKARAKKKVAVLDLGITRSLLRQLTASGFGITLFPYDVSAAEILKTKPQGLILSSGPEEDVGMGVVAENIKPLIGKLPLLGIAAGHQVLCRALGGKVVKMRLGHHGVNYPMSLPPSLKSEITVQNHSLTVDADSLAKVKGLKITGYNLNDRTVEKIESKNLQCLGVQFDPASPGFDEVHPVFAAFKNMMERSR